MSRVVCDICNDGLWLPVAIFNKRTQRPQRYVALCKCKKGQEKFDALKTQGRKVRSYFTLRMDVIYGQATKYSEIEAFAREREQKMWDEYHARKELEEGGPMQYADELPEF